MLGTYGGLAYALPVIGGLLADRWLGMRKAVLLGGLLLCVGHFGMAYEGSAAVVVDGVIVRDELALQVFYLSLALIIVGVGLLKPNISTIVGRLYPDEDPRREAGFTIFYLGINVGAFASSLVCGWLGETWGWGWGFGAAGVGMLAGLARVRASGVGTSAAGRATTIPPLLRAREHRAGLSRERVDRDRRARERRGRSGACCRSVRRSSRVGDHRDGARRDRHVASHSRSKYRACVLWREGAKCTEG